MQDRRGTTTASVRICLFLSSHTYLDGESLYESLVLIGGELIERQFDFIVIVVAICFPFFFVALIQAVHGFIYRIIDKKYIGNMCRPRTRFVRQMDSYFGHIVFGENLQEICKRDNDDGDASEKNQLR